MPFKVNFPLKTRDIVFEITKDAMKVGLKVVGFEEQATSRHCFAIKF